jgi:chromosome segregation ATPase
LIYVFLSCEQEELDRREQLVQQLTAQNDELETTVETLKAELVASHEEIERSARERDALASARDLSESIVRERELREAQGELERCRIERDEWERKAVQERMAVDEVRAGMEILRRELEAERDAHEKDAGKLSLEVEKAANLQSVLEDFQAGNQLSSSPRCYCSQRCFPPYSQGSRATAGSQGLRTPTKSSHTIISRVQVSCVVSRGLSFE